MPPQTSAYNSFRLHVNYFETNNICAILKVTPLKDLDAINL